MLLHGKCLLSFQPWQVFQEKTRRARCTEFVEVSPPATQSKGYLT